jgi:hypothetical protein
LFSIPPYRLTVCPIFYSKWRNKYYWKHRTAGTIINTPGPNNIYVWFEDRTNPFCTKEKSFTITIIPFTALPNYADQIATPTHSQIQMAVSIILEQIKTTYSYTRHHYKH